jgi:FkbM family methyltransferase
VLGVAEPHPPGGRALQFSYTFAGQERQIECFDSLASALVVKCVLEGTSYPHLPFITDVEVVLDVGANVGSAAVWFDLLYPAARIFSFEPAVDPFRLLQTNTAGLPNVTALPFGLHDQDQECDLYHGTDDSITASIYQRVETSSETERIELRSARSWYEASGLDRLDILKLDTEGCELPILRSLGEHLAQVKVIYLEFHSEPDRKEIDELLGATHTLFMAKMLGDEGEVAYVARDCAPEKGSFDLNLLIHPE